MVEYKLEGYELLAKIGEGTYGDVYKAKRIADGKICAIKFVQLFAYSECIDPISQVLSGKWG